MKSHLSTMILILVLVGTFWEITRSFTYIEKRLFGTLDDLSEHSNNQFQALATDAEQLRRELQDLRSEVTQLKQSAGNTTPRKRAETPSRIGQRIAHWSGGPKRGWGHEQATGEPDTPRAGDIQTAWAPKQPDAGEEWLKLDYETPMTLGQINVIESYNPGAISKMTVFLEDGQEIIVWEGTTTVQRPDELVISKFPVPEPTTVKTLKVYLDTRRVSGWNEIDAVQMIAINGDSQWAIGSSASSSYSD